MQVTSRFTHLGQLKGSVGGYMIKGDPIYSLTANNKGLMVCGMDCTDSDSLGTRCNGIFLDGHLPEDGDVFSAECSACGAKPYQAPYSLVCWVCFAFLGVGQSCKYEMRMAETII